VARVCHVFSGRSHSGTSAAEAANPHSHLDSHLAARPFKTWYAQEFFAPQ
jgi:hypothetical protein